MSGANRAARQADVAEFLRIHQASRAVVAEDHVVLRHDFLAAHVLDGGEAVADHLEDDVGVLEREAGHDHAALAGRAHEAVVGVLEVAEDLAEALGLALLGAAEDGEQLGYGLQRNDRVQEQDGLADALEIHVEVGAREAEEDRDVGDREHDRIHQHAERRVAERDRERHRPAVAAQAADHVGAAHLVEDRPDHLDLAQRACLADALEAMLDVRRDVADASLEVAPGRAEAVVGKQLLEQQVERAAVGVALGHRRRARAAQRVELQGEELDVRIDADRAEQAPGDRAEESLQELRVGVGGDAARVVRLDLVPERGVERRLAEAPPDFRDGLVDHRRIELEPLDDVGLRA